MLPAIGKYTVEKVLGEGGFGVVYLAFDPDVGQPVAIKKLRAGGDPDLLRRFQLEIRTTASLRHKNIVTIHASGEDAGDPYLVMEFLEGSTLKRVIREHRSLTLLEKVRIMTQVAEGLAYAHSKGVVHRDVKPENIMLLPDDTVKIMDFGIALGPNRNTAVTQTGGIIGTPPYFAPEQLEGLKANEQTDIFSFGDVYYELLTGNHPFEQSKGDWRALQLAILTQEPPSVGELVLGCPEALELLVHRTLAKSPEFRYQKFEEVQLDSEAILVDLRHEGAAAILREVRPLIESGNLQTAQLKINRAYQLEPGNREVRRLREEINLRIQGEQVQARIDVLLAEAARQIAERRYAEAVQTLESGLKLDSSNVMIGARLQEARARLDSSNRANRLVSEARLKQQKGLLDEAIQLFESALAIDPDHTDARRLASRVAGELERRRLNEQLQQAIRTAREHLAAKRFAIASAIQQEIQREHPGASGVAELRAEIQHGQAEEERRLRAEKFNLALARVREAMQSGDLEHAGPMVEQLFSDFAAEPGAAEVLPALRQRLNAQIRVKEIAQYQQKARGLLREKSFREALALLAEALGKFTDDAGLQRLNQSAQDLFQAHQRGEAVAAVLKEANTKRDAGDLQGALNTILEGRQRLGEEAAFVGLLRQLEMEIEQQRYSAGLESLLKEGRELMAADRFSEAIDRIRSAKEFGGEAEVRALLDAARAAAASDLEKRVVEETLAAAESLQSRGAWSEALEAVERGLVRYPHNSSLTQAADRLRDRVELERRRSSIEKYRAAIRLEIQHAEWPRAVEALRKARSECPGDSAFDDLANQVEAGEFQAGLNNLEARVRQNLAANAVSHAEQDLDATRTMYARDPRWRVLEQEVARRKEYETALMEADRKRGASRLSEAEELLTEIINQGPPDKRADQMRDAIRMQRSEKSRQAEIARIAEEIRAHLKRGDLSQAASELTAARARYPGENVWTELQAEVDTRQQALRRQAESAAAEQGVRQSLGRDDIRQARSALLAARTKFPGEAVWALLETEINARYAVLERQREISAIEDSVRRQLDQNIRNVLLAEAEAPIGTYPIALVWDVLREATARLDQARAKYPGDSVWDAFTAEVAERQTRLEREIRDIVRSCSGLFPLDWNARQLAAARTRYPNEPFWTVLQAEIDARREPLERASINEFGVAIGECLKQNDLQTALIRLDAARKNHPGERVWDEFQAEIDTRQAWLKKQEELTAVERSVREQLERVNQIPKEFDWVNPIELQWEAFQKSAAALVAARAKHPDEDRLAALQGELDARRALWQIEISQEITDAIRDYPSREIVKSLGPQIATLRAREPNEPLWTSLGAEIEALEALLNRQAEVATAGDRVRVGLSRGDIRQAAAELNAARAKYPDESLWATLEAEIDARQALEEQRRREARDRDRDRLLAIERQIETESRKRKRRGLDREAQSIAAHYIEDPEMTAIAAEIHARIEIPRAEPATQKPVPWKLIGGGAAAAAVVTVLVIGLNKKPQETPRPTPIATIPIEIRTDPPGASVRVGDRSCVTPNCRLDLLPGSYPVEAQLQGYEPEQQTVTVDASSRPVDLTLRPVLVPPPPPGASTGTLVVQAGVPDALVYVDRVPQPRRTDESGAVSLSLEAKEHQVRVERNQYEKPAAKQVRITAGKQQIVVFRLDLQSARLELSGAPANLELSVDGKPLGQADGSPSYSFPSAVKPGDHTLEVAQGLLQAEQGSASRSLTQRFESGQTVRLAWKPNISPPTAGTTAVKKQPTPEEIEEQAWEKVRESSNPVQLREFRNKYPSSSHGGEIQTALDRLAWSSTKQDSPESLMAYLHDFPNGAHAPEANSQLAELVWKGVDQSKMEQVRKFAEENKNNPHFRDAQRLLDQFNARQQARKQVLETLSLFNRTVGTKQLTALWRNASEAFLKPPPHTTYELQPTADPDISVDQTQARVLCTLTLITTQPKGRDPHAVTVELRNHNGQWQIEKFN